MHQKQIISCLILLFIILFTLAISQYIHYINQEGLTDDMPDQLQYVTQQITNTNDEMKLITDANNKLKVSIPEKEAQIAKYKTDNAIDAKTNALNVLYDSINKLDNSKIEQRPEIARLNTEIKTKTDELTLLYTKPGGLNQLNNELEELKKQPELLTTQLVKLKAKLDILNAQREKNAIDYSLVPIKGNKLYDFKALDVEYHDPIEKINADKYADGSQEGTTYLYDKSGKITAVAPPKMQGSVTYYKPEEYKYGAASYVPTYEDSVYLSRSGSVALGNEPEGNTYLPVNERSAYINESTGLSQNAKYNKS